jgi:uncharacterized protein (TIGR03435 family)
MRFAIISLATCLSILPLAQAQQSVAATDDPCAAQERASFEVATIRPSDKSASSSSMHAIRDGINATMSLRQFILRAYDLREFQIEGGPGWVNTSVYEVHAKISPPEPEWQTLDAAGQKAADQRRMQRLQSLLAERFHFKCHIVAKELPIYELTLAKGGTKLTPTTAPPEKQHSMSSGGNGRKSNLVAIGIGTDDGAKFLSSEVGRRVVNKTGLTGNYDITLTWMPAMASTADADAASGPTIFTALEEQLGLKLQPAKGPVPVLVIDSVEKPSEN